MADFDSPQQSSSTTGVERSLVDESKFGLGLQPMQNVDYNIFWYLLRDYVAKKVGLEKFELDGMNCIKIGDVVFKASTAVSLFQVKGGIKEFDVDSLVFYCDFVHSPMYLTYTNRAIAEGKIPLRRGDVLDMKPFLLGKTEVLPRAIDVNKTVSPSPFILVDATPEMVVKVEKKGQKEYFTLTHNIRPGLSLTLSGSMYNKRYYLKFLKLWSQKLEISYCKQFNQFPLTELVRKKLDLPRNYYDIFHAYLTVDGIPPTEFYGCGFGLTKTNAAWAAAREIVDRMYFCGLITPKLYSFIGINLGMTKHRKLRKAWGREMAMARVNVRKLQKALREGNVPNWLLKNDGEFEVAQPIVDETKGIVRKTCRSLLAIESRPNAIIRRKRRLVDSEAAKSAKKKRNCYVRVVPSASADARSPEVRSNKSSDANNDESPVILLNLFGSVEEKAESVRDDTVLTIPPSIPSPKKMSQRYQRIINLFGDDPDDSWDDDVAVVPTTPPCTLKLLKTESDFDAADGDDECQIISVLSKDDKIATVTLDESDSDEKKYAANNRPSPSTPSSTVRTATPERPPNRIFSDELSANLVDEEENNKAVKTEKLKNVDASREIVTLDDDSTKEVKQNSKGTESPVKELDPEYRAVRDKLGVTFTTSTSAISVTSLIVSRRAKYSVAFKKFDHEVWQHFKLNSQDDRTFSWKMQIREKLQEIVRQVYPESHLVAVGSTVNGCGAYNSDMDLCLCVTDRDFHYPSRKSFAAGVLMELYRQLLIRFRSLVRKCDYINARIPILKVVLEEPYHELEIDINCNNKSGIYNSHLLHYYARVDDRYPALCLIVKHWAINAGINDAYLGTLSSYTLELLVLHFLQCGIYPPILPNLQMLYPQMFNGKRGLDGLELFCDFPKALPKREINKTTVGELLIAFFDYYARFDFFDNAISIKRGTVFSRTELSAGTQIFKIYVEDPYEGLNTSPTVTRLDSFRKIQNAFTIARNAFLGFCAGEPSLRNIGVD